MIKLIEIANLQESASKYTYGCVMLEYDNDQLSNIHSLISKRDLYEEEFDSSYGLVENPHVTLLYGLHDNVTLGQIQNVLSGFRFGVIELSNPSVFASTNYDVLKFDALEQSLYEGNRALTLLPHTSNFPNYHPHSTIAYLKKGCADRIINKIQKIGTKFYSSTPRLVYSEPGGKILKIKI